MELVHMLFSHIMLLRKWEWFPEMKQNDFKQAYPYCVLKKTQMNSNPNPTHPIGVHKCDTIGGLWIGESVCTDEILEQAVAVPPEETKDIR